MRMSQPNRSRWQVAAGLSRIDATDRRNKGRDDRNRDDNRENCQCHLSASSDVPVEIVVHRRHLLGVDDWQDVL